MQKINIIGCGRAAQTLARLWAVAGVLDIGDILTRSSATAETASAFIGGGHAVTALKDMRSARLWLIGVPDRDIVTAGEMLAASGRLSAGDGVFHLSGFTASGAFAPLVAQGARIASVHPVKSFADPARAVEDFGGTLCGVEGEPSLIAELTSLFEAIGGECFALDPARKPLYHAGSVFASNFLVVIMDVARKAYVDAGVPPDVADRLIAPLARGALENVLALGGAAALTGPAARGDREVLRAQHETVADWDEAGGRAYAALTGLALRLAAETSR